MRLQIGARPSVGARAKVVLHVVPITDQPAPERAAAASTSFQSIHRPSPAAFLALNFLAVYILWGSTFYAMRVGLQGFPPLLLAGTRHLAVGLLLYPILRWRSKVRPTAAQWMTAAISGVLLLCVGNGGVCWAELTVPSG